MKSIKQKSFTVSRLRKLFAQQIFAIPEIQREFVWTPPKACALLDSVYHNMPIGTTMVWHTGRNNSSLLRLRLHILPVYDGLRNKVIWYLIDGQQRLSVFHQVFEGSAIYNASGRMVDFGRIYFTLDKKADLRFEYLKRPDPDTHFRVTDILASNWRQRFTGMPQYKLKALRTCRERILRYQFPSLFVDTNDLDEVRETFIRINSRGTPVSAADRAFARATKLKLRQKVRELQSGLGHGFDAIPSEPILQVIAFSYGTREVGERAMQAAIKQLENSDDVQEHFGRRWNYIKGAVQNAVDYLTHTLGVINFSYLPSQNIVTTLSLFFYHNDNSQPTSAQRREIQKWFWATSICQRYAGAGFQRNLVQDADFFKRLAEKKSGQFRFNEPIPISDLRRSDYRRRSGLTDGFFCMLARRGPRYVIADGEVPATEYSYRGNRKDKHHIFPRTHLKKAGVSEKDWHSVCNICFLSAYEDQSFGGGAPRLYLAEYRTKRYFRRAMASHLISSKPSSPLWTTQPKQGFKLFVNERMHAIANELEKLAGVKLFRRGD